MSWTRAFLVSTAAAHALIAVTPNKGGAVAGVILAAWVCLFFGLANPPTVSDD